MYSLYVRKIMFKKCQSQPEPGSESESRSQLLITILLLLWEIPNGLVIFIYSFIYLFVFLWLHWVFIAVCGLSLVAAGLHCCPQAFSGCSERGLLFVAVCGLHIAVASARALACGLSSCGSWALEHRLSSSGTRA